MSAAMIELLVLAFGETVLMVLASALFSALIGIPLGVALHVTKAGQILAHAKLQVLLGTLVNIGRSVPFIILLVAIIPFTRFIVGTSIGTIAAIVPLTVGAIPPATSPGSNGLRQAASALPPCSISRARL